MAAAGPVPAELRAQSSLGTGMRSHRVASSGGREERRGRETQPKKGGPARKRHQGKRSDCNKEKEEEGRMRERKGRAGEREALGRGREAQTKGAQEADSRAARARRLAATLPGPLGLRVSPMRSLPVTARGRGKSARAERRG